MGMARFHVTAYGLSAPVSADYEQAIEQITAALKEEGFGILTTIDVKETLRQKLGVEDFERYVILGACNPQLAYRAFTAETEIGLLLPCNVIVYERNGQTHVAAMDPISALGLVDNEGLAEVAKEARARLERALSKLPD